MRSARIALILLPALLTGCAPRAGLVPVHAALSTASTVASVGRAAADVAGIASLWAPFYVLAAIGDKLHTGTAGGPSDEAYAARMRSAHIHANDPWVGWPGP
jgi:hypothetical protein